MTLGTRKMKLADIKELMKRKGWSQAELARQLDLSEAAISRWFSQEQNPTGPARILMRQWLDQARAEAQSPKPQPV